MNRGDRVTAYLDGHTRTTVLILDLAPEGWWVYVEGQLDALGHPLIMQCNAADLHPFVEDDLFTELG